MAGAFLLSLARELAARSHEVTAVAPHAAGLPLDERWEGVAVRRYRYGPDAAETLAYAGTMHEQVFRSWRARARLLRLLCAARRAVRAAVRELQPDVIHAHWWFPGGLTAWPGRRSGPALVLTSHGTDLFLLDRYRAARLLAGFVFRAARQVTVVSSPLVTRVQALGVDPSRITVVPMPLDATAFSAEQGSAREPGLLLFAGRLIERKGAEYAVRVVAELRRAGRAVRLVIAGDGPERPTLARLAAELDAAEGVVFRGWLTAAELASLYRRAQVFLLPAVTDWKGEQEGFGMVLVEAMRSGLPVVATRSGGIPDVVRHEETGLLVPPRDPGALAAAVARLLDDSELAARLADAARSDIARRFHPPAIARKFEAVYQAAHAEFLRGRPRTRFRSS
jgi:glycosyltransferase involved in cell wall biosynthesis